VAKLSPLEECIRRAGSDMKKYRLCTTKYISAPRRAGHDEDEPLSKTKIKKGPFIPGKAKMPKKRPIPGQT
jgi:hypothetical protein